MKKTIKFFARHAFLSVTLILALALSLPMAHAYTDLTPDHKYYNAIQFISDEDIVGGYPDGRFMPDQTLNRAELLKIVMEANFNDSDFVPFSDENCFDDVPADQWFTPYICYAKELGIVEGYSDSTFRPTDKINLVEAVKIAMTTFGFVSDDTDPWYKGFIDSAAENNFLPIDFTEFSEEMSRGQMAEMIARIIKYDRSELDDYLGYLYEYNVNYTTLQYNLDVEEMPFDHFYSEELSVAFNYPADWSTPDKLPGSDSSKWQITMGPGEQYLLEAFEAQDSIALVEALSADDAVTIVDDFERDKLRTVIYEVSGICTTLEASIFGSQHTFVLSGECAESPSEREEFFQILSSLDFTPDAELEVIADNPKDPLEVSITDPGEGFAVFESIPYQFAIEYPENWYYYGQAGSQSGVARHYGFYAQDPFPEEELTAPAAPEVAAIEVVDFAAPSGGESVAGGVKISEGDLTSIYLDMGGRKYRITGLPEYDEQLVHMAESLTDISTE